MSVRCLDRGVRRIALAIAALYPLGMPVHALDPEPRSSSVGAAEVAMETWGDYSMMGRRRTGEIWALGRVASQFQWVPRSATESDVYYGDPDRWPPQYRERFVREGDWVMLHGWWDNGTYYRVNITREELCEQGCNVCSKIADSGPQHYVKWRIPNRSYCLHAEGVVTEQSSGKTLRFGHTQVYGPPMPCSNAYHSGRRCIRQWEAWSDDNGTPYERKLEREQQLAKSIGPGFTIKQTFPRPWDAALRQYFDE